MVFPLYRRNEHIYQVYTINLIVPTRIHRRIYRLQTNLSRGSKEISLERSLGEWASERPFLLHLLFRFDRRYRSSYFRMKINSLWTPRGSRLEISRKQQGRVSRVVGVSGRSRTVGVDRGSRWSLVTTYLKDTANRLVSLVCESNRING